MIPNTRVPQEQFEKLLDNYENKKYSSKDFKLSGDRIKGYVDSEDSLAQAIYFILSTERYQYASMSDKVGVELQELYGDNDPVIELVLASTIREAILSDDRVQEISGLEIERVERDTFSVKVEVLSNIGETVEIEKVVSVNG